MIYFNLEQLKRLQVEQATLVDENSYIKRPKTLLAVSVLQRNEKIKAGGVLFDLELNTLLDSQLGEIAKAPFPYLSTFLTLRNKQPLLQVISKFRNFDLLMVEGAGRQHPRHYGLACELGVELDIPTIGITKKSLFGVINFSQPLGYNNSNFDYFPVFDEEYLIAYFIKKRKNKKGIYLSIGHKITLQTAIEIVSPLLVYKFPEPLRLVKKLLKKSI